MNIKIYQINMDRDKNRVCFVEYNALKMFQGSEKIDSKIYDKVFSGEVECKSLECVYRMFNLDHPENYKGRNLSVSDIIQVVSGKTVNPGYYYCDSIGFKKVSFNESETL